MEIESISVRERLHKIVDDLEVIIRQLAEIMTTPRDDRTFGKDTNVADLVQLFRFKEDELKMALKIASEQAERQRIIEQLEQEVRKRDDCLLKIRNCLRDSESLMTNAIFQANQKLKSIAVANNRKVSMEDLIRYSHRISASNAVSAPLTWQQGDPQRPYPTDAEMRVGWLSRMASGDLASIPTAIPPSGSAPSTPNVIPGSGVPPFMQSPGMHHSMDVFPHQRQFSPSTSGIFPQGPSPGMVPPRGVPGGWVAQRALTPPNISPRAIRLPPPPPFHQVPSQQTPPLGGHFMGPVSPMAVANVGMPMHPQMHHGPSPQSPLVQQQQQQMPPMHHMQQQQFGARASPQMHQNMRQTPPGVLNQLMQQHSPYRQASPMAGRPLKNEPGGGGLTPEAVQILSSDSSSSSSSDTAD